MTRRYYADPAVAGLAGQRACPPGPGLLDAQDGLRLGPVLLELVEVALGRREDVDDHPAEVEQDPVRRGDALAADRPDALRRGAPTRSRRRSRRAGAPTRPSRSRRRRRGSSARPRRAGRCRRPSCPRPARRPGGRRRATRHARRAVPVSPGRAARAGRSSPGRAWRGSASRAWRRDRSRRRSPQRVVGDGSARAA